MTVPVDRFRGCPIAVIGDVMLDHFLIGDADRISPEAPVPIMRMQREEYRLGGAANVAANIASLGAVPVLCGMTGDDTAAGALRAALAEAGISDAHLVRDSHRPTTEKLRAVTTRHQQVARIDRESSAPLSQAALHDVLAAIASAGACRAVILSDYAKGVVTPEVIVAAGELAHRAGAPLLIDPKRPHAAFYRGATVITPNHREAELMTSRAIRTTADARVAAEEIAEESGASVVMTWGEHGMFVFDRSGASPTDVLIPAAAREVADVTGAGDTVIAALALAMAAGASLADAAAFANRAAGVVVARFGTATVTPADLA